MCRSVVASARHASRQPSRSSSAENGGTSRLDTGTAPSAILILHFLQVPCPPQVESMAMPFQLAASNTVTPAGTLTLLPLVTKTRSTRGVTAAPGSASSARVIVCLHPVSSRLPLARRPPAQRLERRPDCRRRPPPSRPPPPHPASPTTPTPPPPRPPRAA